MKRIIGTGKKLNDAAKLETAREIKKQQELKLPKDFKSEDLLKRIEAIEKFLGI